jgi:ribosomal protein L37E
VQSDPSQLAERHAYLYFTCPRCRKKSYSDSAIDCPRCGYSEDEDSETDYSEDDSE